MVAACRGPACRSSSTRTGAGRRRSGPEGRARRGEIGRVFRARIAMVSGFPVFVNQPFLDDWSSSSSPTWVATSWTRPAFSSARPTPLLPDPPHARRHPGRGRGDGDAGQAARGRRPSVVAARLPGNALERERFPRRPSSSRASGLGRAAARLLGPHDDGGWHARSTPAAALRVADPIYDLVHASIVPCNANLLGALRGEARRRPPARTI